LMRLSRCALTTDHGPAWHGYFVMVSCQMSLGLFLTERVKLALPPLVFAPGAAGAPTPQSLVLWASDEEHRWSCSAGFLLAPVEVSVANESDDMRAGSSALRFVRCWWTRLAAAHWRELLGNSAEAALLPDPPRGVAGRLIRGALAPLASEIRQVAFRPTPWQQPSVLQATWWQSVQRCATMQAEVIEGWNSKLASEWI